MRHCAICKKTSQMQGERKLLRGHYNPVNWSRKYPNLQWARVDGVRVKACTGCLRTATKKANLKVVHVEVKVAAEAESK
jgi:ribosomal protein L28